MWQRLSYVLAYLSGIATLYGTAFAFSLWALDRWPPQPNWYYWVVLFAGTVLVPTLVVTVAGWWCAARAPRGVELHELVIHFLDVCYFEVGVAALEAGRENGSKPGMIQSRKETARVLTQYVNSFRTRYQRDKELLRRIDPQDASGVRERFVELKQQVIHKCEEAKQTVARELDAAQSRQAIAQVGVIFSQVLEMLDHARNQLASRSSRTQE